MSTTARDTRSRTRVLRRFSSEMPSLNPPSADDITLADGSLSADESQWEDVHSVSDHDDSSVNVLHGTPGAVRRTRGTVRRRRRPRNPPAPTRRLLAAAVLAEISSRQEAQTNQCQPVQGEHEKPITKSVAPPTTDDTLNVSREELARGARQAVSFTLRYILDVVRIGLTLLRRPLGVVFFLFLLGMILSMVSQSLRTAFAPLCWLPGISSSLMCRPAPMNLPQQPDYQRLVEVQTRAFEHLLDETTGGSFLSAEVRKAGMATSDLVVLVRDSTIKSRDVLAQLLSSFVDDARKTAKRLQSLHAKVGGSVDMIMAANEHALRTIEEANTKKPLFSIDTLTAPWARSRKVLVASTFSDSMDTLSKQISRLILEAEANMSNLDDLEERLNAIHELIFRDINDISADREELLALLWTMLGGNKKKLRTFDDNLALLKNVGKYRRQARLHVVTALQTLQSLGAEMEDLRERVALPGLAGEGIPLEVQIKGIQYGLERLQEDRVKARKIDQDALRKITGWTDDVDGIEA